MAWRFGGFLRLVKPFHHVAVFPASRYTTGVNVDRVNVSPLRSKSSKSNPVTKPSVPSQPPPHTPSNILTADAALLKAMKKELKEASQLINKYKIEIKGSFDPFELVTSVGTSDLTLRRQIGPEVVLVKCSMHLEQLNDEDDLEDDEEDLNVTQRLSLTIQLSKSEEEPRVAIICSYRSDAILIDDISYLHKCMDDEYPYCGPYFSDLNPNIKKAFENVIKDRGIDSRLSDLIMDHLSTKYQDEYIQWLHNVRAFLKR